MSTNSKAKYVVLYIFFNIATYFFIQSLITVNKYNFFIPLDSKIPFVPEFIWIYHTLLPVMIFSTVFLIEKEKLFLKIMLAFVFATFVLSIFYITFPSFYPRPEFETTTMSDWVLEITRILDGPHNTFPSGHVTFSWLLAFFIINCRKTKQYIWIKYVYFIWAVAISISTLTLKQHYIFDVLSGIILAMVSYAFARKVLKNRV